MEYKSFPPLAELSDFIKCYWNLTAEKEPVPQKQRIVPDGCMEMIFHYKDPYLQYLADGTTITQPHAFVFGQISQPLDIEPTGDSGIFAVRFNPGGFTPFVSFPIKEMENRAMPLSSIFGEAGISFEKEVLGAGSVAGRMAIVNKFLLDRLASPELTDKIIQSAVETIITINGQLTVSELSQQMNINRRQLERKFSSAIGLSPKQLFKIIRLQSTLRTMMSGEFTTLTSLAYEGEFYDQAHFIKDFKEFTGLSPKKFYADNLKMSALFYGPV